MNVARSMNATSAGVAAAHLAKPSLRRALRRGIAAVALAGLTLGASVSGAAAQDARGLMERIDRLERDVRTLQQQVYRSTVTPSGQSAAPASGGGDLSGDAAAILQSKIAELERLLTSLTGTVEENQYQVQRVSERLNQLISDMDFRLSRLEQQAGLTAATGDVPQPAGEDGAAGSGAPAQAGEGGQPGVLGYLPQSEADRAQANAGQPQQLGAAPAAGAATASQPAATPAAVTSALPEGGPEQQYDHAFSLLRKADYPAAEEALKAFLERHPDHELAGNAKYWLGETYYVRGDYQRAAVSFLEGYQQYPKSSKGADNLLKLGLTMANLDKTKEACAAFQRIVSEYPQASDVIKRRASAERDRLSCG